MGNTFTLYHALVKKAILEGKRATVPSDLLFAVGNEYPDDTIPRRPIQLLV